MIRQEIGFFDKNDIGKGKNINNNTDSFGSSSNSSNTGTLTAKLATETSLVKGLNVSLGCIIEILVTIVVGFIIAFFNGWKLTLILLTISPFLFIGTFLEMQYADKTDERRAVLENSSRVAVDAITSIKTVYALNLENYFCKLYDEKLKEQGKHLERKQFCGSFGAGFSNS
eukprot:jgi/Orpsp1_1/1184932/evm.model.c7180000091640.1